MSLFGTRTLTLAALGLAALISIAPAFAQSAVRVQIPFDFQAGDQVLPAGKYVVTLDHLARRLDVRLANSSTGAYVSGAQVHNPDPSGRSTLMFHQYGDKFFLRSVAVVGQTGKYQIAASNAEREMAKANTVKQFALVVR